MRRFLPSVRLGAGLAVVLACLGVLVASSTPNLIFVDDPLADLVARKLGHLFAFMAIAFGAGLTAGTSLPRSYTAGQPPHQRP